MAAAKPSRSASEGLWDTRLPLSKWPLWLPLVPAAGVFAMITRVRNRWWQARAETSAVPVISVGNLTVGGNGKTPFTLFVASRLRKHGFAVAIASRGWGGRARQDRALLVSDGNRILSQPREAGDEPIMMARNFDGPIAVARHRIDAISILADRFELDAVILDDGFQHLRLRRDLDLLLMNEADSYGNGWLLPAGPLREPPSACRRADAIVLIGTGEERAASMAGRSTETRGPRLFRAWTYPSGLVEARAGNWHELPLALNGVRVAAVSGVARPHLFHRMLRALGARVERTLDYPDHYDYGPSDWENVLEAAHGCEMVLTTEKDLVKLERFSGSTVPVYALRLQVAMNAADESELMEMAAARISDKSRAHAKLSARPIPLE
jgi:tetraacyldisaccharide 4'-kinase